MSKLDETFENKPIIKRKLNLEDDQSEKKDER